MNNKKYIASILGVLSLILITSGVTLAVFSYVKAGQTENSITTDGITFIYNEESKIGRGIQIVDAIPMTDNQGKTQTNQKFDFRIVSKPGNTKIKYTVTARKISSGDTLDSLIDLYLTDQASSDPEVFLDKTAFSELDNYKSSTVEKVLYEKVIDKNDTVNGEYNQAFRLRMWLDSSADFSDGTLNNKEFKIIVNVNAVNYTETSGSNSGAGSTQSIFSDLVLAKNTVITTSPTLNDSSNNTNDASGLYQMTTSNGFGGVGNTTYYFRGDVDSNIVEFGKDSNDNPLIWRIIRINEDGTIRLILDQGINNNDEIYKFNNQLQSYIYMYYSESGNNIKKTVNDWFTETIIGDDASKVASGNYFCEAARVKSTSSSSFTAESATMLSYDNYTPDLNCGNYYCDSTVVTKEAYDNCIGTKEIKDGNGKGYVSAQAGLITYDEVVLAGGYYDKNNNYYYLYKTATDGIVNNYDWWTMSPAGLRSGVSYVWNVGDQGYTSRYLVYSPFVVRPVINLKADTLATYDESTGHYIVQ